MRWRRRSWGVTRKKGGPSPIPGGNSRETLPTIQHKTLVHLATCLNAHRVPLRVGEASADSEAGAGAAAEARDARNEDRTARDIAPLRGVLASLLRASGDMTGTRDLRDARAKIDLEIMRRLGRAPNPRNEP